MDYLSNEFFFEGSRLVHIKLYFDVHKVQLFMVFRYKSLSQLSHQKTNMAQNLKYLLCNFTTAYSLRRPFLTALGASQFQTNVLYEALV